MLKLTPELRSNPELQSALVRIGFWIFAVAYVGLGAATGYYRVDIGYFFTLFAVYLFLFLGMLASVLMRPVWEARRYVGLALDITATSLAIFLTREAISPFYLIYIWIFISAGTRYGRTHLIVASVLSVFAYNLVLIALDEWQRHTYEAVFFMLLLVLLPLYQHSLLRKVQEARREAETANRAKGNFLAVMTHELRTPLTGVIGMAHLLQTTRLSAEQREYVDSIASSAEVLRALIGDVLDLSKIDASKLHLESIAFDLRATLHEVCASLENLALGKGLELILRIDPQLPKEVIGDQLRVRQILFNLAGNAIKFTDRGEVRVRASLRPAEGGLERPHVLLEVEDTGIGISSDKLEEIFEDFWQADDSTTRRYGGTGLGTTIARDLTRLMGGRIGVDSEENAGSRFWVRLPLFPDGLRPVASVAKRRLSGYRAIVYDDNQTSRDLIVEVCTSEGMACDPVGDLGHLSRMSGQAEAADLLIIADSPKRQDLGALLELFHRVLGAEIPYLLLTYRGRRADDNGARSHCLNKPFLPEDLVEHIGRLLAPDDQDQPEPEEAGARAEGAPAADASSRALPVLVAEDNEIAAKVITKLLAKQGLAVTLVQDGAAALEQAALTRFAVAFVDLRMPKLDGIAFTRAYRKIEGPGSRLPIIALTANASSDVKERCLAVGMDDFLGKPVKPEELAEMVRRYARAGVEGGSSDGVG